MCKVNNFYLQFTKVKGGLINIGENNLELYPRHKGLLSSFYFSRPLSWEFINSICPVTQADRIGNNIINMEQHRDGSALCTIIQAKRAVAALNKLDRIFYIGDDEKVVSGANKIATSQFDLISEAQFMAITIKNTGKANPIENPGMISTPGVWVKDRFTGTTYKINGEEIVPDSIIRNPVYCGSNDGFPIIKGIRGSTSIFNRYVSTFNDMSSIIIVIKQEQLPKTK
jgi:hypothetical protein